MRIRRGLALLMALLLTLLFALPAGADETGTYDFIFNDEILKFSAETPVVEKDGFTCVPFDYFFRQFGGSYIYDDTIRNLTWFHFGTTYSFNISTGTCTVDREAPVPAPAFYQNGAYYLPMEFIAEQLGYIFTRLPNGTCRLVTREKLNFADEDFMLMYSSMYSEGSTERARPNFYLVVPGQPSSNTAEILSALDRYGVSATFFMTEEAMRANPALTRLIVSSGYPYGFTLPESGDMLAYVERANEMLQKMTRRKTALTFVASKENTLSAESRQTLEGAGYLVWDSNFSLPTSGADDPAGDLQNLNTLLRLRKFNSVVTLTGIGLSSYLPALSELDAAGQISLVTAGEMEEPLSRWSELR